MRFSQVKTPILEPDDILVEGDYPSQHPFSIRENIGRSSIQSPYYVRLQYLVRRGEQKGITNFKFIGQSRLMKTSITDTVKRKHFCQLNLKKEMAKRKGI